MALIPMFNSPSNNPTDDFDLQYMLGNASTSSKEEDPFLKLAQMFDNDEFTQYEDTMYEKASYDFDFNHGGSKIIAIDKVQKHHYSVWTPNGVEEGDIITGLRIIV